MTASRRRFLAVAVVLSALAAFGGTAVANHVYSDVPTSSAFHDEIAEFGEAGCADGFPGGTFHPNDAVKRQQMARFFTRCAGRATFAATDSPVSVPVAADTNLVSVTFTAPATGQIVLQADATGTPNACTSNLCTLTTWLKESGVEGFVSPAIADTATTTLRTATGNSWAFPIAQGETRTFTQVALMSSIAGSDHLNVNAQMTAMFVPFSLSQTH